jgi:methanogenic corrinoid protein MtbC1
MQANDEVFEALTARFIAAQLAGDTHGALAVVDDGLHGGLRVSDLYLRVIRSAQLEIGRRWQENRVTIAQEHLATGITQLVMANLYPRIPRSQALLKRVIIACVEGEQHDVGPRICADFLEMAGFQVRFLGANVPATALQAMVNEWQPDVVVLSITLPVHARGLREAVNAIRSVSKAPLIAGGYAFAWDRALGNDLALTATGIDAEELVTLTQRALGFAA